MIIVHYIPSIDQSSGGVGIYMQLLATELGKLVELHIITHRSPNELPIEFCQIHYIDDKWWFPFHAKKQFLSILETIKPDILHINSCWYPFSAYAVLWNHRYIHIPMIYSPHGMLEPWIIKRNFWTKKLPALILYQKKAIRIADAIHTTANSEKENLLRLGYNQNIFIVPNGIDLDSIELKKKWQRCHRILFLSRLHEKKGINFLIEAVSLLKNDLRDYSIIIAGEGEEQYIRKLKSQTEEKGVSHLFNFIGGVYGSKKWELYQHADVFVLPTHSENFGIVVAEALASGTPVITTKGTPWSELETHHCGWWVEIGTVGLTSALKDFLTKSDNDLQSMGIKGRELISCKYSTHIIANKMLEEYNIVLSSQHTPKLQRQDKEYRPVDCMLKMTYSLPSPEQVMPKLGISNAKLQ